MILTVSMVAAVIAIANIDDESIWQLTFVQTIHDDGIPKNDKLYHFNLLQQNKNQAQLIRATKKMSKKTTRTHIHNRTHDQVTSNNYSYHHSIPRIRRIPRIHHRSNYDNFSNDNSKYNDNYYDTNRDIISDTVDIRKMIFGSIDTTYLRKSCYNSLPLFLESGTHHKTGHRLAGTFRRILLRFCTNFSFGQDFDISSQYNRDKFYFQHNNRWPLLFPDVNYFTKHKIFGDYTNRTNISTQIVLLSFVRSPLDTIISGFNYHSQCPESWTKCAMVNNYHNRIHRRDHAWDDLHHKECRFSSPRWINGYTPQYNGDYDDDYGDDDDYDYDYSSDYHNESSKDEKSINSNFNTKHFDKYRYQRQHSVNYNTKKKGLRYSRDKIKQYRHRSPSNIHNRVKLNNPRHHIHSVHNFKRKRYNDNDNNDNNDNDDSQSKSRRLYNGHIHDNAIRSYKHTHESPSRARSRLHKRWSRKREKKEKKDPDDFLNIVDKQDLHMHRRSKLYEKREPKLSKHMHTHTHTNTHIHEFNHGLPEYYEPNQFSDRMQENHEIIDVYHCFTCNASLIKQSVLQDIAVNGLSVCELYKGSSNLWDDDDDDDDNNSDYHGRDHGHDFGDDFTHIRPSKRRFRKHKYDTHKENKLSMMGNTKQAQYDIIERLYFEMVRFINCEFDSHYKTHELIKQYKYGFENSMEYYTKSSENFDKWLNDVLINMLGFKIGQTIDKKEYNQLVLSMQKLDIHRMSQSKVEDSTHITRNSQDSQKSLSKDTAIQGLLSFEYTNDDGVIIKPCELIKQMTLKLDYEWEYTQYC